MHHGSTFTDTDTDAHQGMRCTVMDEALFDLTNQPYMHSSCISRQMFDDLPRALPDDTNSDNDVSVVTSIKKRQCNTTTSSKQQKLKPVKFGCDLCKKTLFSAQDLKEHTEIHRGVRKVCGVPMCVKTFTRQQSLALHMHGNCHVDANGKQIVVEKSSLKDEHIESPKLDVNQSVPDVSNLKQDSKSKKQVKLCVESNVEPGQTESTNEIANQKQSAKPKESAKPNESAKPKEVLKTVIKTKGKKLVASVVSSGDDDFDSQPLPEPGTESHDFFDNLVKAEETKGGKIIFICKKCATTATRKSDVKRHWNRACPKNPCHEIRCKHCPTEKKFYVRGHSKLVVHLQTDHNLVGDYVCLGCQALFGENDLLEKHVDKCKGKVPCTEFQ